MNSTILKGIPRLDKNFIKRNARKIKAISYLGKVCHKCKKNLFIDPWTAEFHHKKPKDKDYTITDKIAKKSWFELKEELDKCILLCSECHCKIHFYGEKFDKYRDIIYKLSKSKMLDKLYQRKATAKEITEAKKLFLHGMSYKEIAHKLNFKEPTIRIWIPANKLFDFENPKNEDRIIEL